MGVMVLGILALHLSGNALAEDLVTRQLRDEARAWQSKDRDDLAADTWSRLLIGSPQHGEAMVSLGLIAARAGDMVSAREWYVRASRLKTAPADLGKLAAVLPAAGGADVPAPPVTAAVAPEPPADKQPPAPKLPPKVKVPKASKSAKTPKTTPSSPKPSSPAKVSVEPAPVVVPAVVQVTPIVTPVPTPIPEPQTQAVAPPKPRPSKALPYFPPL